MLQRLYYIIMKEFTQIRKSPEIMGMIVILPIVEMIVFGYAAVIDVKNINTAILDKDHSSRSRELQDNFRTTSYFILKYHVQREKEIEDMLDHEKVFVGIVIPPDFSKRIDGKRTTQVQVLIDGTNASAASIISNYAASTIISYSNRIMKERGIDISKFGALSAESRFLYNPTLDNKFFFLPGIFAMIILVIGLPMTARAIVREKEQGTLEQIIVTPIKPLELIIGKVFPYTLLTLISSTGILLVTHLWFHLPLRGSLWILYLATILFLLNAFGIGIFISSLSSTQQQAMLTTFFVNMPMILFSGFMFPVQNMPILFQYLTYANPMYYFLNIIRDLSLKGSSFEYLKMDLLAMGALGVLVFTASIASFRKRMD